MEFLLILAVITAVLIVVLQQGKIPTPIDTVLWVVIVVVWLILLLRYAGMGRMLGG
jgi:hypothetical protein